MAHHDVIISSVPGHGGAQAAIALRQRGFRGSILPLALPRVNGVDKMAGWFCGKWQLAPTIAGPPSELDQNSRKSLLATARRVSPIGSPGPVAKVACSCLSVSRRRSISGSAKRSSRNGQPFQYLRIDASCLGVAFCVARPQPIGDVCARSVSCHQSRPNCLRLSWSYRRIIAGIDEPKASGLIHRQRSPSNTELLVNLLKVPLHSCLREAKAICDVAIPPGGGGERQDIDLPGRERAQRHGPLIVVRRGNRSCIFPFCQSEQLYAKCLHIGIQPANLIFKTGP